MSQPTISTSLRVPSKLMFGIELLAAARRQSKNSIFSEAVTEYLAKHLTVQPVGTPLTPAPGTPLDVMPAQRKRQQKIKHAA